MGSDQKKPRLRSQEWFGKADRDGFMHRSWMKNQGYPDICSTEVVLHVSPVAAAGGTLALVKTGDFIELDVPGRRLHLDVGNAELATRRARVTEAPAPARGWYKLYTDHVQQAHLGADLDILVGGSGTDVPRDSH